MKNSLRYSFFAVAAVLVAGATVFAQDAAKSVAHIPFAFHAGASALPAGTYTITPMGTTNAVIRIMDKDTRESIMLLAPRNKQAAQPESKLVFQRYGDQYFLSQIWTEYDAGGRVLKTSKLEKEMRASVQNPAASLVAVAIGPR